MKKSKAIKTPKFHTGEPLPLNKKNFFLELTDGSNVPIEGIIKQKIISALETDTIEPIKEGFEFEITDLRHHTINMHLKHIGDYSLTFRM